MGELCVFQDKAQNDIMEQLEIVQNLWKTLRSEIANDARLCGFKFCTIPSSPSYNRWIHRTISPTWQYVRGSVA